MENPPINDELADRFLLSKRSAEVKLEANRLGFSLVGIAPAVSPTSLEAFQSWLNQGFAGEMSYMERRLDAYRHPSAVLNAVRSIVMLGINYTDSTRGEISEIESGAARPESTTSGSVAKYARGSVDYHDVIRGKLKELGRYLKDRHPGSLNRGIVDTAPLLERDYARLAGLGWFGKNTLLINRRQGSYLFLAALLTDVELEPDVPHNTSHCGTCTRCLEACPTDAFVAPYVLDARKCISYLTIELRGEIPQELRSGMGDWIFGCDICQDVCPWNRKAKSQIPLDPAFASEKRLHPLNAVQILMTTEEKFASEFGATPFARTGREGMARNAAIVLGNSRDPSVLPILQQVQETEISDVVRDSCEWAIQRLLGSNANGRAE